MFPDFVYEEPRAVLREIPGVTLVEMERNRDCAWCCGAGGGVLEAYPDFNTWTARERVLEALTTGADALVTACPWCESNFREAVDGMGLDLQVLDLVQLVRLAQGGE
jgi:Fe-S oxidoreductase